MRTDTSPVFIPTDPVDGPPHLSDWLDVLIHPRRATERITYMYGGLTAPALVILSAVTTGLWLSSLMSTLAYLFPIEPGTIPVGGGASGIGIVVFAVIFGGVLSLYVSSGILTLVGKLLGGDGSYGDVVLALALSTIPVTFATTLLAGINWLAFRLGDGGSYLMGILVAVSAAGIVLAALYRIVILVFGLSGVHRFSAWRSLATLAVMWVLYLALDACRLFAGQLFL